MTKDLIIGIDESNHGRFPEYFVAVSSQFESDALPLRVLANKNRPKSKSGCWKVFSQVGNRGYTFLSAEEDDYSRISQRRFPGIITGSLLYKVFNQENINNLYIFFDGIWKRDQELYLRDYISESFSIERNRILLTTGPDLDKKYKIVNLADRIAHTIFRWAPPSKISEMPQRRTFLE